ncbi:MAG: hydrogenase maturation protease [Candidatus Omnitrophica bacterium]|nr:hydrogenase maturation protease [Candidatus Omnitrophota bacterium]
MSEARILVLALGNDIRGDDAVGLLAARRLAKQLPASEVDVVESDGSGFDMIEVLEGRDYALLLDCVVTGDNEPGTILEYRREHFAQVVAGSPHYAGLPEVFRLAEQLSIPFPGEVLVLGMEVADPFRFEESLTEAVAAALPGYVDRAAEIVKDWALLRTQ